MADKTVKILHLVGPGEICKICGITRPEVLAKCHDVTLILDHYYRPDRYNNHVYSWIPCIQANRNW